MKNYVKEYKGYKVPEGATKFLDLSRFEGDRHEFYKVVKGRVWYFDYDDKVWAKATMKANYSKAIELPEAQQEWSGEGLPPIGTVCECFVWTNFAGGEKRWVPRPVIGYSKTSMSETHMGKAGIVIDSCERDGQFIFCDEFRPLKTQQEKDREAFIGSVKQLLPKSDDDDLILAGKLFELGFTAPKAIDNE